jgi:hypothetical protein
VCCSSVLFFGPTFADRFSYCNGVCYMYTSHCCQLRKFISWNKRPKNVRKKTDSSDKCLFCHCDRINRPNNRHTEINSIKDRHIMKMAVLWDVSPCSLVDIDRCFRGAYCLHHQGDIYQITRCNIREDSRLHTPRRENLNSGGALLVSPEDSPLVSWRMAEF